VTHQCVSWQEFVRFILTQEGEHQLSGTQNSWNLTNGKSQALFLVRPVPEMDIEILWLSQKQPPFVLKSP
jgi:hypothetical protein